MLKSCLFCIIKIKIVQNQTLTHIFVLLIQDKCQIVISLVFSGKKKKLLEKGRIRVFQSFMLTFRTLKVHGDSHTH